MVTSKGRRMLMRRPDRDRRYLLGLLKRVEMGLGSDV